MRKIRLDLKPPPSLNLHGPSADALQVRMNTCALGGVHQVAAKAALRWRNPFDLRPDGGRVKTRLVTCWDSANWYHVPLAAVKRAHDLDRLCRRYARCLLVVCIHSLSRSAPRHGSLSLSVVHAPLKAEAQSRTADAEFVDGHFLICSGPASCSKLSPSVRTPLPLAQLSSQLPLWNVLLSMQRLRIRHARLPTRRVLDGICPASQLPAAFPVPDGPQTLTPQR
ncbi:hypothetical protein OH77DRAFT_502253 [Trametes cingulata]|nr:hypothetical protein OH77DRAFT_502253 [Trametes cingulata]